LSDAAAVTVHGLRKLYGSHEAVKDIDFEVRQGEIFGFLGTNGAGKTTTIEILEGYRSRTAGAVTVLGVDSSSPTRAWRARIGLVLQESELDPVDTPRETVAMFASYCAAPRGVDETLDLVGLHDKRDARGRSCRSRSCPTGSASWGGSSPSPISPRASSRPWSPTGEGSTPRTCWCWPCGARAGSSWRCGTSRGSRWPRGPEPAGPPGFTER